jgi:hypothetical protein
MCRAAARIAASSLLSVLLLPQPAASVQVGLDSAAISEALRIRRGDGPTVRDPFHAGYRVAVDDPVVRAVEIVSEFRRLVQLTEERQGLGDVTWDAPRAANAAQRVRGLLDLVVFLEFDPRNTYRGMPAYSLVLHDRAGRSATIAPVDSRTRQSYVGGQPAPPGTPILAATVTATFDATRLDPSGQYLVGILFDGREVRRVAIDLGSVR